MALAWLTGRRAGQGSGAHRQAGTPPSPATPSSVHNADGGGIRQAEFLTASSARLRLTATTGTRYKRSPAGPRTQSPRRPAHSTTNLQATSASPYTHPRQQLSWVVAVASPEEPTHTTADTHPGAWLHITGVGVSLQHGYPAGRRRRLGVRARADGCARLHLSARWLSSPRALPPRTATHGATGWCTNANNQATTHKHAHVTHDVLWLLKQSHRSHRRPRHLTPAARPRAHFYHLHHGHRQAVARQRWVEA